MTARHLLQGVAVAAGFGLVALGGSTLDGAEAATLPFLRFGVASGSPWWGWSEIGVGLLLTQPSLHRIAAPALVTWALVAVGHVLVEGAAAAWLPLALLLLGALLAARSSPVDDWSRALPAPLASVPRDRVPALAFATEQVALAFLLRWAVGGILFWAALPLLAVADCLRREVVHRRALVASVVLYVLFYGYGAGGVWNFVGHFFMADVVAASVGWPAGSPFQQELAFYALGTGVVGLMAPWWRDHFWVAAAAAPSIFAYGAAFTHIEDYLTSGNSAPANWGAAAVGANLVIPTAVLLATWYHVRLGRRTPDLPTRPPLESRA